MVKEEKDVVIATLGYKGKWDVSRTGGTKTAIKTQTEIKEFLTKLVESDLECVVRIQITRQY